MDFVSYNLTLPDWREPYSRRNGALAVFDRRLNRYTQWTLRNDFDVSEF